MGLRRRLLLEFDELCTMVGLEQDVARRALEAGRFPAPESIGDGPCWDAVLGFGHRVGLVLHGVS
jgi:predicted DNA-binding transcriptional regulator AlpA